MKRLVLVGGGHSHAAVLKRFGERPVAGVEIVLIKPGRFAPYSGMVAGLIAGPSFQDVLNAVEFVTKNNYPARGEA